MGYIDSGSKSNRILASRRYTHNTYTTAQESFTNVLDLRSEEIYTQGHYVTSSGLPHSGSSQQAANFSVSGSNITKYWYRHKLTKSNVNNEVWFFLNPTGSSDGVGAQLIHDNQEVNFVSPKYAISSLANSTTEDGTPGYLATLLKSTSTDSGSLSGDDIVSTNDYQFDYKTGVLQFINSANDPTDSDYLYMTVYQYVGKTLKSGLEVPGSVTSSDALITNNLEVQGNVTSSITSTGSFGYSNVDGDAVVGGNLTFGDADTDSVAFSAEINSNFVPDADSTYDIGSSAKNWRYGYVEQVSATNVTASGHISGSLTSTGSVGYLNVIGDGVFDGNTKFGDSISDIQRTTGSVEVSASSLEITASEGVHISSSITVSSSAVLEASTTLGTDIADVHRFTGSLELSSSHFRITASEGVHVTGSMNISGGLLTVENFTVSGGSTTPATSSVLYVKQADTGSFASGSDFQDSTTLGNTIDDLHRRTGSVEITASRFEITASEGVHISSSITVSSSATLQTSTTFGTDIADTHRSTGSLELSSSYFRVSASEGLHITGSMNISGGLLTVENLTVSGGSTTPATSSVLYVKQADTGSFASGSDFQDSTTLGNTIDDIHRRTGSVELSSSYFRVSASEGVHITGSTFISGGVLTVENLHLSGGAITPATASELYVKYAQTGSFASGSDLVQILAESSSYVLEAETGSFASGSDFQDSTTLGNTIDDIHRRTGSVQLSSSHFRITASEGFHITGSTFISGGNVTVDGGILTVDHLHVSGGSATAATSSVLYVKYAQTGSFASGSDFQDSTTLGNSIDDLHRRTGSVEVSASTFEITASEGVHLSASAFVTGSLTVKSSISGSSVEVGAGTFKDNVTIGTVAAAKNLDIHGNMIVSGNITTSGSITAQEFHTEFVSASVMYASGSTKFGDTIDDIHRFTGSVYFSASQVSVTASEGVHVTGSVFMSGGLLTVENIAVSGGSTTPATSSTAYVKLNQTGSFASGSDLVAILAESSSYVMSTSTGSFASGSDFQASTTLGNAVGNIHRRTGSLELSSSHFRISASEGLHITGSTFISGGILTVENIAVSGGATTPATSSVLYVKQADTGSFASGSDFQDSTTLGNTIDDIHRRTGSLELSSSYFRISASEGLHITGSTFISGGLLTVENLTVSGGATTPATSSVLYVKQADTGSFASGSDLVQILAESSSYVLEAETGSFASGSDFQASTTLGNAVGNIHRRTGSLELSSSHFRITASEGVHVTGSMNISGGLLTVENLTVSGGTTTPATSSVLYVKQADTGSFASGSDLVQILAESSSYVLEAETGSFASGSDIQIIHAESASYVMSTSTGSFASGSDIQIVLAESASYVSSTSTGSVNVHEGITLSGSASSSVKFNKRNSGSLQITASGYTDSAGGVHISGSVFITGSQTQISSSLQLSSSEGHTVHGNLTVKGTLSGSQAIHPDSATGSVEYVKYSQTGSFASGSDLQIIKAESASYVVSTNTGSFASGSDFATSTTLGSGVANIHRRTGSLELSSSHFRITASEGVHISASANITGSLTVGSTLDVYSSLFVSGNISTSGSITAREFHTEFVSSSIRYASGSNKFGDTIDDLHRFTGSLEISASRLEVTASEGIHFSSSLKVSGSSHEILGGLYLSSVSGSFSGSFTGSGFATADEATALAIALG